MRFKGSVQPRGLLLLLLTEREELLLQVVGHKVGRGKTDLAFGGRRRVVSKLPSVDRKLLSLKR
jgi:hypothetical protein